MPTCANFILVRVGKGQEVFNRLLSQGVIVRPMAGYQFPEHVRVTVGTMAENEKFIAALEKVIKTFELQSLRQKYRMAVMFQKMVIAGVGLICGSWPWICAATSWSKRSSATVAVKAIFDLAKKNGIIDSYFLGGEEFPTGVDFLMMGTPVETIVPLTKTFLPKLEPGCVISDVGSVKGEIVRGMERLLPKDIYFRCRPSDRG